MNLTNRRWSERSQIQMGTYGMISFLDSTKTGRLTLAVYPGGYRNSRRLGGRGAGNAGMFCFLI